MSTKKKTVKKPKQTITKPENVIAVEEPCARIYKEPGFQVKESKAQTDAAYCDHCKKRIPKGQGLIDVRRKDADIARIRLFHKSCWLKIKKTLAKTPVTVPTPVPETPKFKPLVIKDYQGNTVYLDPTKVAAVGRLRNETFIIVGGAPIFTNLSRDEVLRLIGWEA